MGGLSRSAAPVKHAQWDSNQARFVGMTMARDMASAIWNAAW